MGGGNSIPTTTTRCLLSVEAVLTISTRAHPLIFFESFSRVPTGALPNWLSLEQNMIGQMLTKDQGSGLLGRETVLRR